MAAEATMTAKGSKRGARVLSVALLAAIGAYLADRVMLFTTPPPAVPGASAAQTLAPAYDRQRLLQTTLFGTAAAPLQRRSGGQCAGNPPCPHAPRTLQRKQRIERPDLRRRWAAAALFRRGLLPGGLGARGGPKGSSASPTPGPARGPPFSEGAAAAGFRTQGTGPSAASAVLSALPPTLPGVQDTRRPRNASANPSSSRQRSVSARATPSASASYGSGANAFSPRSALRAFQGALAEQGRQPLRAMASPPPAAPAAGNNQVPAAALAQVGLRPGDRILSVNGQGVDGLAQNPQQIDAVPSLRRARLEVNMTGEPFS